MTDTLYRPLTALLKEAGFELCKRQPKGSHVKWVKKDDPANWISFSCTIKDRHMANKILKFAGIKDVRL